MGNNLCKEAEHYTKHTQKHADMCVRAFAFVCEQIHSCCVCQHFNSNFSCSFHKISCCLSGQMKAAIAQDSHLRYGVFSEGESTPGISKCLEAQKKLFICAETSHSIKAKYLLLVFDW